MAVIHIHPHPLDVAFRLTVAALACALVIYTVLKILAELPGR
jgi:hypothetical protein